MAQLANLVGQKFGRLTVDARFGSEGTSATWRCICSCGRESVVSTRNLRSGNTKSCGCLRAEVASKISPRNEMRGTKEWTAWRSLKDRCLNKNYHEYGHYGGRGIGVFPEWANSFARFYKDVGPAPSRIHQIDRYPDNNGSYEPGNVRWALPKENCRNKRSNRLVTLNGKTMCIIEWSEELGIKKSTLSWRLRNGWSDTDALTIPVERKFSRSTGSSLG